MHELLEFIRIPLVVTVLSSVAGAGVGLGMQPGDSRAMWASASAVCVAGVTVAALAPDAVLAPSVIALSFVVTATSRNRGRRQNPRIGDEQK